MNKVYKVIWSKVRNCYMVVSELAKRNGKCSSALNKKIIAAFLASGIVAGVHGEAWAAITGTDSQTGQKQETPLPYQSSWWHDTAIALGMSPLPRAYTPHSIAIGNGQAGIGRWYSGGDSTQDSFEDGGYSIAIGYSAQNYTYSEHQTDGYYANTKYSVAIGYRAHTHAANAFAIGASTDATAERSFAIGTTATQETKQHLGSRAAGQGSIAFGDQAMTVATKHTPGNHSDPESRAVDTDANDAMAIGTHALARAKNAVSLGGGVSYTGVANDPFGIERGVTVYGYDDSGKIGGVRGQTGATVNIGADAGIALGGASITLRTESANVGKNSYGAIAIGTGAAILDDAPNSVAVGVRNTVTRENSTAVGQGNQVAGKQSGAFGSGIYPYSFDRLAANAVSGDIPTPSAMTI